MKNTSKTDWNRLKHIKDEDIDTSDIPELGDDFFKNAILKTVGKKPITIRLDKDVLEWFKGQGQGYQSRINQLLRRYMETHQSN